MCMNTLSLPKLNAAYASNIIPLDSTLFPDIQVQKHHYFLVEGGVKALKYLCLHTSLYMDHVQDTEEANLVKTMSLL